MFLNDPIYSLAFFTGLLGSGHCLGMCGPIVAAFSLTASGQQHSSLFHILYNMGRITTYTGIGVLVGWFGSSLAYANTFANLTSYILLASDIFIIIVGLGAAGLFSRVGLINLEFPGPMQKITAAAAVLRRLPTSLGALPLGMVMGFLPCGFLYAMIITAAQTAEPTKGALSMLSFGLGTLPTLVLFGSAAHWLSIVIRTRMIRMAGIMIALMGAYNLYRHLQIPGCCSLLLS